MIDVYIIGGLVVQTRYLSNVRLECRRRGVDRPVGEEHRDAACGRASRGRLVAARVSFRACDVQLLVRDATCQ